MTTPESKEKCCDVCLRTDYFHGVYECFSRKCHCHQRPESDYECSAECSDKCKQSYVHGPQRPESDWKPALTKLLDICLVSSASLEMQLVDFIDSLLKEERDAAYQRGLAEGARQGRDSERNRIFAMLRHLGMGDATAKVMQLYKDWHQSV